MFVCFKEADTKDHKLKQNELTYHCTFEGCTFHFFTHTALKKHVEDVHQAFAFVCPYCQKRYRYQSTLKEHLNTHRHESLNIWIANPSKQWQIHCPVVNAVLIVKSPAWKCVLIQFTLKRSSLFPKEATLKGVSETIGYRICVCECHMVNVISVFKIIGDLHCCKIQR